MKTLNSVTEDSKPLQYMKQLDGLRAIAVFAVIYTHYLPSKYWLFNTYWGGFGVKLFFVLSGFLITGILLKCRYPSNKKTLLFNLRQFYIRRFIRIFPLFYAILAVAFIVNIPPVRETIAWHIPYFSNVYFAIIGNLDSSISHFWSLAVEEQFYLFYPWIILLLPKRLLLPAISLLIFVGIIFRVVAPLIGLNEVGIWVLTPGSLDILGLGSLLAYLKYENGIFKLSQKQVVNAFALIGIALFSLFQTFKYANSDIGMFGTLENTSVALMFTWVIAQTSIGFKGIIGQILESKLMVYLGKISYGLYVIHNFMPALVWKTFHLFGITLESKPVSIILSTIGTIVLASVSWQFFERPINNFKKNFPYKNAV